MAAPLLGKCVGLLGLVVLLYTCCYGFRIREHGGQTVSPSIEQFHRSSCTSIFGRCTEKTSTATSTNSRKWYETASRVASSRKPPVEVTSPDDDDDDGDEDAGEEGVSSSRSKLGKTRYSMDGMGSDSTRQSFPTRSVEVDEDDDEEEAIVEVEVESTEEELSDEQVVEESGAEEGDSGNKDGESDGEDDDYEDEVEEGEEEEEEGEKLDGKHAPVGGKTLDEDEEEEEDSEEDTRTDLRKRIDGLKLSWKKDDLRRKGVKAVKSAKLIKDEDEEEGEEDVSDDKSGKMLTTEKDLAKTIARVESKKRDKVKEESEQDDEDKEDKIGDEKSGDKEEADISKIKEVSTPPPRKLEKVRHADKEKVRSAETLSSSPVSPKPKVETKVEPPKKQEAPATKVVDATKKPVDISKKTTESTGKPVESTMKSVDTEKSAGKTKKSPESAGKPAESMKVESKATKAESKATKAETSEDKSTSKLEEKGKSPVKPETPKAPAKTKDQTKQAEKTKVKPVNLETIPRKSDKVSPADKKESKPKAETGAQVYNTLAELNDAILHVPTFVPNFTAIEDVQCQQQGKIFLRQLRGYKLWALQMLDSSAKIPSGLLRGNVNQFGDFDQCLGVMAHVKFDDKTIKVQGKYCLASIDLYPSRSDMKLPVNLMQSRTFIRATMRDSNHFIPRFPTVNWGLCLPAACTAEDAKTILEQSLRDYNVTAGIKFIVDVDPSMCYVKQKTRSYSKETIGVLYFFAMVVCLVIVATIRDYLVVSESKGSYSERIIMAFSLRRTVKDLLKVGSDKTDIMCIHGIRSINTILIYIVHLVIPLTKMPYVNRVDLTEVGNHPLSIMLRVGMVYTDVFLLLSGFLTSHNMIRELKNRGEIRWFCRLISRYMRLTPSLLALVFWYAFIMEHVGSGPLWNNTIMANAELCKNNAWTNLLYIQNFFPMEEMCATHTHQLALDMQLSLTAPIFVFVLYFKPILGILLISFVVLLAATLSYIAITGNNLSLIIFHGISTKQLLRTANLTYILPHHRITPYAFGVGLGVLLHYIGRNVRIHKVLVILGWLVSVALASWSLFSPWRMSRRDYVYDVEDASHYTVITPTIWALAHCWIIFACFTGNGGIINRFLSNYWFLVFSKISYAVYLTQFAVFFYNVGITRYPREFQAYKFVDPLEALMVIAVSVVMTLFFDFPAQKIKSVLMESTDRLIAGTPDSDKKEPEKAVREGEEVREEVAEKNGITSAKCVREKDKVEEDAKSEGKIVKDEEPLPKKTEGRRRSLVSQEAFEELPIPAWNRAKASNKRISRSEEEHSETGRRSRNSQRDYRNDSEEELAEFFIMQQEREGARRRSLSRTRDNKRLPRRESEGEEDYSRSQEEEREEVDPRRYRRSESKGRSSKEPDEYRSWEFIGKERSSSRGPDDKRVSEIVDEYEIPVSRQARPPQARSVDQRKTFSSESEEEPLLQRKKAEKKIPSLEPSDEEEWENELRIRRKQFMEKLTTQQRELLDEKEHLSPSKRSLEEGRIALKKDPSEDDNTESWTVTVSPRIGQLGSSQEPSEPEDDNAYRRERDYRERAPSPTEDTHSEEEIRWNSSRRRSYTSGSQPTSMEDEEDISSFNFILTKESKRTSLQDLSKLSQEDIDLAESEWNVGRKESTEPLPKNTLGLYKRESIIKSQASEEDPEYLLPERPKLVQQEREHPFKKAWQMQKSRSEEDGSTSYVIRESKNQQAETKRKNEDSLFIKRESSGEQSEDIGTFADDESDSITLSRSRSTDTEENGTGSKSEDTESTTTGHSFSTSIEDYRGNSKSQNEEEPVDFNWPNEDEQYEAYRTNVRRKSEETDWNWEQEET